MGLAIVALFAQLDQQARLSPQFAFAVPDRFSANSARERSQLALSLGDADAALEDAQLQVSLRPMPAESLSLLGLAAVSVGDAEQAREALGAASRRGWREPVSQLASGRAALSQGNYAVAAQRAIALLSTGSLEQPVRLLVAELVTTPEGREAMAAALADFDRWPRGFILIGSEDADPEDWSQTLGLAAAKGADLPCFRMRGLASRYRQLGNEALGATIASYPCSAARGT